MRVEIMATYTFFRSNKSKVLKENSNGGKEKKLKICIRVTNGYIRKASILSKSILVSKGNTQPFT